jgi:hypothetical protein
MSSSCHMILTHIIFTHMNTVIYLLTNIGMCIYWNIYEQYVICNVYIYTSEKLQTIIPEKNCVITC